MTISFSTNIQMAFLLIFALSSMVEASSKFSSTSACHKKIEVSSNYGGLSTHEVITVMPFNNLPFVAVSSLRNQKRNSRKTLSIESLKQHSFMLNYRGGGDVDESDDSDSEDQTEVEEDGTEDSEYDEEESEEDDTEDYYDDEDDTDTADDVILADVMKKSESKEKKFVDPYFISSSLQIYTTFGTILLSRKIDSFSPKIVRLIRFLFVLQLVIQQAFIFYVRIMAKRGDDRTPVELNNPLSNMVESQLESVGGGNDMVKNLASSFLKKELSVREYDIRQTSVMQGSILFNMLLMWVLHFKMQQVQPLLVSVVNGFLQLVYNPLFQVYIMRRNLERPFKNAEVFKSPTDDTDEIQQQEVSDTAVPEDNKGDDDEVTVVADGDGDENADGDGDENANGDGDESVEEDEDSSDKEMDDDQPEGDIEESDEDGEDDDDDDE